MIIVSQDGKTIVNFHQATKMYVGSRFNGVPLICAVTSDGGYETMGNYTTELRGKEVLKEIVHEYEDFIIRGSLLDEHGRMAQGEFIQPKVYRMPEV